VCCWPHRALSAPAPRQRWGNECGAEKCASVRCENLQFTFSFCSFLLSFSLAKAKEDNMRLILILRNTG
jgi:hypothetical protein